LASLLTLEAAITRFVARTSSAALKRYGRATSCGGALVLSAAETGKQKSSAEVVKFNRLEWQMSWD
jgi:hypothetical protein